MSEDKGRPGVTDRMPNLGFGPGDTGNAKRQSLTAPQFLSICGNRHLVERLGRFAFL
jgi:hypothetical protein